MALCSPSLSFTFVAWSSILGSQSSPRPIPLHFFKSTRKRSPSSSSSISDLTAPKSSSYHYFFKSTPTRHHEIKTDLQRIQEVEILEEQEESLSFKSIRFKPTVNKVSLFSIIHWDTRSYLSRLSLAKSGKGTPHRSSTQS